MFFTDCKNPQEVKTLYRKLCKQYHPDLHGHETTATMQAINAEYHERLQQLDKSVFAGTDGKDHTYYYKHEVEQDLIEKVQDALKACAGYEWVTVDVIGSWVWIDGTRREDKELQAALKEIKFTWHSKRQKWYYRKQAYRSRYNKNMSYEDLKNVYGCSTFPAGQKEKEQERKGIAA